MNYKQMIKNCNTDDINELFQEVTAMYQNYYGVCGNDISEKLEIIINGNEFEYNKYKALSLLGILMRQLSETIENSFEELRNKK